MLWPDKKQFAFTIFDDPDGQLERDGRKVYDILAECGFLTTKGVWPVRGPREPSDPGETCGEPHYLAWVKELQQLGFEVGYHNATSHTSTREETIAGLDRFREYFGHDPHAMAHHYFCRENLYWASERLTGAHRLAYDVLTRYKNERSLGHVPGQPYFWGDIAQQRITYVRNFVFDDVNTLNVCPFMPYHDPLRPYVRCWYASSEGSNINSFLDRISEANQDKLEAEGGACIMYVHFGHGFCENGSVNTRAKELLQRLSKKNGWFVPVTTLLEYLRKGANRSITKPERAALERRWLLHKIRFGSA